MAEMGQGLPSVGIVADLKSSSADPSIPDNAIDRPTEWRSVPTADVSISGKFDDRSVPLILLPHRLSQYFSAKSAVPIQT